jgi:hypothetical protein
MQNGIATPGSKVEKCCRGFTWYLASVVSRRSDKLNHMGESIDESIDPLRLLSASPLEEFRNLGPTWWFLPCGEAGQGWLRAPIG